MTASGPGQPGHLLIDVLKTLGRLSVPSAVVGGFAVSFHGVVRGTDDADAAVWLKGTSLDRADLVRELKNAGFQAELKAGESDDPIAAVIVLHDKYGNRADLLLGVRGMDSAAPSRVVPSMLLGSPISIIGAEDLIAMKIFAGGAQDLDDVKNVLQVSGSRLDLDLLRRLTRRYGAGEAKTLDRLLHDILPKS
jgi:hypothetical protein